LTREQVGALDPYAFLAVLGKRVIHPGGRASTDQLLAWAGLRPGDRVLDTGCGVQDGEFAAAHIPGAQHRELGSVAEAATNLSPGPLAVMCGHGERAATAASVLERAGRPGAAIVMGGPQDWPRRPDVPSTRRHETRQRISGADAGRAGESRAVQPARRGPSPTSLPGRWATGTAASPSSWPVG
jgi:rhodanese-related sulfurtransferase